MLVTAVVVNASDYSFLVPLQQVRIDTHRVDHRGARGGAATAPDPRALPSGSANPRARHRDAARQGVDARVCRVSSGGPHAAARHAVLAISACGSAAEQALVGALIVGSTIRIVLRPGEYWDMSSIPESSVFAPASLLEPTVIAVGLLLMRAGRRLVAGRPDRDCRGQQRDGRAAAGVVCRHAPVDARPDRRSARLPGDLGRGDRRGTPGRRRRRVAARDRRRRSPRICSTCRRWRSTSRCSSGRSGSSSRLDGGGHRSLRGGR